MKLNKVSKRLLVSACCSLMFMSGCEYDKGYKEIWPTDKEGAPEPRITRVQPDSAYGGVTELTLTGENFSPVVGENFVYFGTTKGIVQTASATQLTVIRPITAGGSLTIQLSVRDALRTATYSPYKLEQGIVEVGELGRVYAIALDRDENVYAHQENKTVVKLTPDGQQTQYDIADFKSSAMRMGPDGYLYIQRYNHKNLYRIPPGGGSGTVEKFTIKDKVSYFDFDESHYIYSGGEKGLFVTNPDGSGSRAAGKYDGLNIKAVRVFEGYVYVAADTIIGGQSVGKGIWKHEILANGDVKEKVLVFDWTNSSDFSRWQITDVTFSQDGDMYVGTNKDSNPVLIVDPDQGTTKSLLSVYQGVFVSPTTQLCWGNGNYLYVNRLSDAGAGVKRIAMGKKGAPYYGRQ